jgi:hypothetical protein
MSDELDQAKDHFLREAIKQLQATDPTLTFRQAWNKIQREHPEYFDLEQKS